MRMSILRPFVTLCLIVVFMFGLSAARAGEDETVRKAEALLARADARIASLQDVQADVRARARVSLLPTMEIRGRVYAKRPHHLKVEIEHLPSLLAPLRQQMQVEPPFNNRKAYVPRWVREEGCDGKTCDVIELKARDASKRLQKVVIWLDRATTTVPRNTLEYADGTQCAVATTYGKVGAYLLPERSEVEVRTLAMGVRARVTYSQYKVNGNLPVRFFDRP